MNWALRHLAIFVCVLVFSICSESADLNEHATFREDFSAQKLSVIRWGAPTFSMYKFRADSDMVWNASGINYLKLGTSDSYIFPTGFIYAKEHFSYGSYSARIRVSDMPGAVASFFTCTEITNIFSDGTHDEIDFEFITARPHSVLIDIREWHDYRFDWFPERVDFYIDGIKRWTSTEAIPKRDMKIALHIYTIDTWTEVEYPPKGEVLQMTDWVEFREFKE
jgi:hypothetical protein